MNPEEDEINRLHEFMREEAAAREAQEQKQEKETEQWEQED